MFSNRANLRSVPSTAAENASRFLGAEAFEASYFINDNTCHNPICCLIFSYRVKNGSVLYRLHERAFHMLFSQIDHQSQKGDSYILQSSTAARIVGVAAILRGSGFRSHP